MTFINFQVFANIRGDGAMISVALDATIGRFPDTRAFFSLVEKVWARSSEPAIVDIITRDFPRPISSARIPPLASSSVLLLTPLMRC